MRIFLTGMKFHAYHGVYPNEKLEGGSFEIDLELEVKTDLSRIEDQLENTVDYVEIYHLVSKVMDMPVNLLEEVALRIGRELRKYSQIEYYRIRVSKLNAPIGAEIHRVSIEIDSMDLA